MNFLFTLNHNLQFFFNHSKLRCDATIATTGALDLSTTQEILE